MKMISCHIENFGKLHDYSMDFSDGANMICEENGWGKSTFAAFIRAMFYGLEDRKRNVVENERRRYKPWQGGVFGGQLVFEIQGKQYLISRVFKEKEANDEFELRDVSTNLLSKDYTDKIGEEIFKINRESFLRTVFIAQNQCETLSTDDINAKIGKLTDNSNDLNHFEAAVEKLTKILNGLNPNRSTGTISKRREEIAGYERLVNSGAEISDSMERYQKMLKEEEDEHERLKEQLKEVGEIQKKVSKQQFVMAKKSEWERLKNAVAKKMEEKEVCVQKFPSNIPALEDVKKKILECNDMDRSYDKMTMYHVTQAQRDALALLADVFLQGTPSDADFDEMQGRTEAFRRLSQDYISEQMSPAEKERLDELTPYFENGLESVTSVIGKWNNRNIKKAALPSKQAALAALKASMETNRPKQSTKIFPLMIMGIILVLAGLLVAVTVSPVVGILTAAAGAGLAAISLLSRKKAAPAVPESSPEFENLRQDIEEDETFVAKTDEETADYLISHGKEFHEDTVSVVLQEIIAESMEYSSLKKKFDKTLKSTTAAELEDLRQTLENFFGGYGIVSSDRKFVDDLYLLKDKAAKYQELSVRQKNFAKAKEEYEAVRKGIVSYLNEYQYEASDLILEQLSDIRDCVMQYLSSVGALEEAVKELDRFETENAVSELGEVEIDESLPTLENLNQEIRQITEDRETVHNHINSYNKTLEDLQERCDEWEENCIRLEDLKEQQKTEQKMYEHISMAKKKLEQAKEAMTAKYADPIRQGFGRYYEMITGKDASCFHIDANTTVTVDELGRQRDTDTLSSGYRDLVGICLRIALVDAMYQEEEPPLIMDDPFTCLDDKKVDAGMEFMEKLAEKYQIIYFTCSAGRKCRKCLQN